MKEFFKRLQKIENGILIVTFLIMVFASFCQVVNRNLVHAGISWFEELARYSMIYMTLLATELGLRDNTQIAITAVTDMLRGGVRYAVGIVARIVVIAFAAVLFVNSFALLKAQITYGQLSPGLGLPMYIPYFALPFSFGIITVKQAQMLIDDIRGPHAEDSASTGGEA